MKKITVDEISIRTKLRPGDIGDITALHGKLYSKEYGYGIKFESYVAAGFHEFFLQYDESRNRVWICEHNEKIIGFLLLMDRGDAAQLRCFLLLPEYRGIGLGNKLMEMFTEFLRQCGYRSAFLWTTNELHAAAHLYSKFGFKLTEEKNSDKFGKMVVEQRYDLFL